MGSSRLTINLSIGVAAIVLLVGAMHLLELRTYVSKVRARQQAEARRIERLDLVDVTIAEALQRIGQETGVQLRAELGPHLVAVGKRRFSQAMRDVTLRGALQMVLAAAAADAAVDYQWQGGQVVLTDVDSIRYPSLQVYDVREVLADLRREWDSLPHVTSSTAATGLFSGPSTPPPFTETDLADLVITVMMGATGARSIQSTQSGVFDGRLVIISPGARPEVAEDLLIKLREAR